MYMNCSKENLEDLSEMLRQSKGKKLDLINKSVERVGLQTTAVQKQICDEILSHIQRDIRLVNARHVNPVAHLELISVFSCRVLFLNVSEIFTPDQAPNTVIRAVAVKHEVREVEISADMLVGDPPQLLREVHEVLGGIERSTEASRAIEFAALKRWIKAQQTSFGRALNRPSDDFLLEAIEQRRSSVTQQLRASMREEEDDLAVMTSRLCFIGPLNVHVLQPVAFLQECLKSLVPSPATNYDRLLATFDVSAFSATSFVDVVQKVQANAHLKLVYCANADVKCISTFTLCLSRN